MKLTHALGFIAVTACLSAGCAGAGTGRLAGVAPVRGGVSGLGAGVTSRMARGIDDDHMGGGMSGAMGRDDIHVNESASFSDRDPQFAGPTPQVPIPHDGRSGQPSNW